METLDAIEAEIDRLMEVDARVSARRIELIRAADRAQVAFVDGARDLVEWVTRRFDVERDTARRWVRTARGIPDGVFDRLADGEITADRAHAYTEATLAGIAVDLLDGVELAGVGHLCRRRRRDPVPVDSYLVVQPQLDEAGYQVHGRLGAVQGSVVTQALEAEADRLCDGVPPMERPSRSEVR
ncbi:MAG: hypothetical protein AB1Z57_09550, partial [Acidimicrobiia bacterium]